MWSAPGSQYVPGQSAANNVSLVGAQRAGSVHAYELVPGGLRPLRHDREMGGLKVVLDEFGLTSLALLSHDAEVQAVLGRQVAAIGPRAAEIERTLAAAKFRQIEAITAQLATRVVRPARSGSGPTRPGNTSLASDAQWAARQYEEAWLAVPHRAMRALRLLERAYWDAVVLKLPSPVMSPATVSFPALSLARPAARPDRRLSPRPQPAARRRFRGFGADAGVGLAAFSASRSRGRGRRPGAGHGPLGPPGPGPGRVSRRSQKPARHDRNPAPLDRTPRCKSRPAICS